MTNDRIAPSDLSRRHLSSTVEIERPARTLRSKLAKVAGVASMLVLSLTALPSLASAACDLSEADIVHGAPGIPEGAIMAIDPGGVRGELAKHGIEVGGAYYGEAFYDWGGIKGRRRL